MENSHEMLVSIKTCIVVLFFFQKLVETNWGIFFCYKIVALIKLLNTFTPVVSLGSTVLFCVFFFTEPLWRGRSRDD